MNQPEARRNDRHDSHAIVVFTDLDGTLLDSKTYSFDAATDALNELRTRLIPLVLVSSKTRAEIEPIRSRLGNRHPFIVENGGAVILPTGYFPFPVAAAQTSGPYLLLEFGTPYTQLRQVLTKIAHEIGIPLRGYGDMSVNEVAQRTGLSLEDAALSKERDYDEPFVIDSHGQDVQIDRLAKAIADHGLRWTTGDRFHHLMGAQDKGDAVRHLIRCYQTHYQNQQKRLTTLALGNSLNDVPMLAAADTPILVQLANGSYTTGIDLPRLIRAPAPGPAGWNQAVLSFLS